MAFFRRVIDHLLNQVLVDSLANSRWFQRFAVWSHSKMQNLNETAKDPNAVLDQTLKAAQTKKEAWDKWNREFQAEMKNLKAGKSSSTKSSTTSTGSTKGQT